MSKNRMFDDGVSDTGLRFSFPTRADRNYTIEQRDGLDAGSGWYDLIAVGQGTGSAKELEVPLPWSGVGYWRLRVAP
jgi:hypothetical protein